MAGYWVFTNLTTSTTFEPHISGLTINNAQPCQLATLSCTVTDPEADQVFNNHDAIRVTFNGTKIFEGTVEEYEQVGTGPGPRIYQLTAQDYTALLARCVIDEKLDNTATFTNRVGNILDHFDIIAITRNIESVSDEIDPLNSKGMTVEDALRDTSTEVGGSYYIDFDSEAQVFVTPPSVAAPFDIRSSESPDYNAATDPPISGLRIRRDSQPQANAIYVKGTGVSTWRTDDASIATWGRYEAAINDPSITRLRKAERVGDAALGALSEPQIRGSVVVKVPGLEPMQTVRVDARTHWSVNEDFIVVSTSITYVDLFRMEMSVEFADRFTPCNARNPSAADLAQDDTDDGDDDPGGTGDGECIDCQRITVSVDADHGDLAGIAFGGSLSTYLKSDANDVMSKFSCALNHKWTAEVTGSDVYRFGHEPGSETPVLAFPKGIRKVDGTTFWNRSGELDAILAAPMDRPRFWAVGESGSGGGGTPSFPFQGYGTFEADYGPQSGGGATQSVIVWRCFVDSGAGSLSMAWDAGEIYKALAATSSPNAQAFAKLYWTQQAGWTDPNTPPTDADIANWSEGPAADEEHNIISIGGSYAQAEGVATGWRPVAASGVSPHAFPGHVTGRWLVIYSQSVKGESVFGATGLHLGFTISGTRVLDCEPAGGGGGTTGPVLEARNSRTGALIDSVDLAELPVAIRVTPNGQYIFLRYSDNSFEIYDRDLDTFDTLTISGFATNLQDWCVDDDYNVFRMASNAAYKYNRDGELLVSLNLNTEVGYSFPTGAAGYGQMIADEHVRVVGVINSQPALLTLGRPLLNVRSRQIFKSDGTGKALNVGRNGQCLNVYGYHTGDTLDGEDVAAGHWLMRLWAARAE